MGATIGRVAAKTAACWARYVPGSFDGACVGTIEPHPESGGWLCAAHRGQWIHAYNYFGCTLRGEPDFSRYDPALE